MAEKDFSCKLRRGLGSAIIELKNNPYRTRYRDIVLRCCLRDIAYDTQFEGTKGYYLYTAIKTFDDPKIFLDKIVEKNLKKVSIGDSQNNFMIYYVVFQMMETELLMKRWRKSIAI